MRNSLVALAVLLFGLSPALSTVAQAQAEAEVDTVETSVEEAASDTPQPNAPPSRPRAGIEEIVVQAGESDAAADLEAGDSVTGFDASDLEALGAQSIEDLAGFTPNLEIVTTGSTTPTFFIRGVGLNDFNANSSGAVAIYQDDVPKNSPALQLSTLFDMEGVNILRGPQGTGPARSASAGAIKLYSRKPSGNFGGYLRSEIGNFEARDFEGAVEMPLFEDIVSARLAFRYSDRDGYAKNNCASNPRRDPNNPADAQTALAETTLLVGEFDPFLGEFGHSVCGERVFRKDTPNTNLGSTSTGFSTIPDGLPSKVNDRGNWATRGMLRFQPTLDQDWLLALNLSRRDELSRLGQSIGTGELSFLCDEEKTFQGRPECQIGSFGSRDGAFYTPIELIRARNRLDPCFANDGNPVGTLLTNLPGCEDRTAARLTSNEARLRLAKDLVLDSKPYEGDYRRVGKVTNDVWGVSLKGDIAIGDSLTLRTVTGYDLYDRFNDVDLDFTPNQLFEIVTDDEGWQVVQDLSLSGSLPGEQPINWTVGGFALYEELDAFVDIFVPSSIQLRAVTTRNWEQKLWSAAGYFSFDWDIWDDFTLDGGVRYNWETKELELDSLGNGFRPENPFCPFMIGNRCIGRRNRIREFHERDATWQSPTGTIRMTYRFREDTHAYWKYTRGWKGGHFNTTVAAQKDISVGRPEKIDAFEAGLRGSWFNGRLGLNGSIFHYGYQQYQIFTVVIPLSGTPEFQVLNASDAEVYGAELEVTARPLPGMFLDVRFSWLESQFLDFKQQQAQTRTVGTRQIDFVRELDFSGNRLLNSPPFKLSLTAEQTLPLGRYGSLTARWDGAWTDDTSYDASEGLGTPTFENVNFLPENTIGQEAYWIHNFRLGYRTPDGSIELAAWVRNANDALYKSFAFDASALIVNQTTIYFLGEPRTYGLSLTASF